MSNPMSPIDDTSRIVTTDFLRDLDGVEWAVLHLKYVKLNWSYDSLPLCHGRLSLKALDGRIPNLVRSRFSLWKGPSQGDDLALFSGVITEARFNHEGDRWDVRLKAQESFLSDRSKDLKASTELYQGERLSLRDILDGIKDRYGVSWEEGLFAKSRGLLDHKVFFALQEDESVFDFLVRTFSRQGVSLLWNQEENSLILGEMDRFSGNYSPEDDPSFCLQEIVDTLGDTEENWHSRAKAWDDRDFLPPMGAHKSLVSERARLFVTFSSRSTEIRPGNFFSCKTLGLELRVVESSLSFSSDRPPELTVNCIGSRTDDLPPYLPSYQEMQVGAKKYLAEVVKITDDPEKRGRVQVALLSDKVDHPSENAWLPVLIPFEGVAEGFYLTPQPGDHVIIECVDHHSGMWAVTGSLRKKKVREGLIRGKERSGAIMISEDVGVVLDNPSGGKKLLFMAGDITLEMSSAEEKDRKIALSLGKGAPVMLLQRDDDGNVSVKIKSSKKGRISLESEGEILLKGDKIRLDAKKSIFMRASGALRSSKINLKDSGSAQIAASKISLKT